MWFGVSGVKLSGVKTATRVTYSVWCENSHMEDGVSTCDWMVWNVSQQRHGIWCGMCGDSDMEYGVSTAIWEMVVWQPWHKIWCVPCGEIEMKDGVAAVTLKIVWQPFRILARSCALLKLCATMNVRLTRWAEWRFYVGAGDASAPLDFSAAPQILLAVPPVFFHSMIYHSIHDTMIST